ncbi:hypothetical protein AB0I53_12040 [Saccharopolyspora sp. NPDC050389]|uniref:hypothetical protein n=1 Tax=Saccharopolyspora sp. NPDC050389 TaxID=3155516 RepID=UPI0033F9FC75
MLELLAGTDQLRSEQRRPCRSPGILPDRDHHARGRVMNCQHRRSRGVDQTLCTGAVIRLHGDKNGHISSRLPRSFIGSDQRIHSVLKRLPKPVHSISVDQQRNRERFAEPELDSVGESQCARSDRELGRDVHMHHVSHLPTPYLAASRTRNR